MGFAREDINFENINREADVEILVKSMVHINNMIAHLEDEQFAMRNEIKGHKETINKLEGEIWILKKEKRWNMLWQNRLEEDINHTQIALLAAGAINVLFTYFMSR